MSDFERSSTGVYNEGLLTSTLKDENPSGFFLSLWVYIRFAVSLSVIFFIPVRTFMIESMCFVAKITIYTNFKENLF